MKKKILALLMTGLMVTSLAACGGSKSADTKPGSKNADGSVKTIQSGKLVVATNAEFPPYEYHEGDKIVGIDMEIADAIGLLKKANNVAILQNQRWHEILGKMILEGEQRNLSEDLIIQVFKAIHQESINRQERVVR